MADVAQEFGLSRAWRVAVDSAGDMGEREAVLALAFVLPLGALLLGFLGGVRRQNGTRGRSMSFGSGYMSIGSWPKDVNMGDPIITAILFVDRVPQQADMEKAAAKMLRFHNFRALPERSPWRLFPPSVSTRFEWRDIEVRPGDVITRSQANGSVEVLAEIDRVKDLALRQTTPDGKDLPLWGMHVIENTGKEEGDIGSVVALRVHHSIGDGMSLVAVGRSILEAATGGEVGLGSSGIGAASSSGIKAAGRGLSNFSIGKILRGVRDVIVLSTSGPDTPLPFGHFEGPFSGGGDSAVAAAAVSANGQGKRGGFSGRRRTVLLPDLPLSLVKKIREASATTVNDVIMSLAAGCIRRYSEANSGGQPIGGPGFKSRSVLPVALPRSMSLDKPSAILCNKWAFVSMDLSVDEADPAARLQKVHATMADIKTSPTAGLQYMMQCHVMPHLPLWVCREMAHGALATHTLCVSNVPGPQEPVTFAGVGLRRVQFVFSNMMPQVGAVSLDGMIAINFVVDPVSVPNSETLALHFVAEIEALAEALGTEVSAELSALRAEADVLMGVMEAVASVTPTA